MTRIGAEVGGVDLAQGLPNFDPPAEVIEALQRIILDSLQHQYTYMKGRFLYLLGRINPNAFDGVAVTYQFESP
ncbi:MAG: hypothetical protein MUP49_07005, partial [Dehalococcoidia bacterium]|nr:hypothetical protein [Dehalococcoidia bacterium]